MLSAISRMCQAHRTRGAIVTTGIGKSARVAQKVSSTMSSYGFRSFFLDPVSALHGDMGQLTDRDVFLAFSKSGTTQELLTLRDYTLDWPWILICDPVTTVPKGSGVRHHNRVFRPEWNDIMLPVHCADEGCPHGLAPMASTTASQVVGDALVSGMIVHACVGPEEFKKNHPGGALGEKLTLDDL